jgi:DNA-binding HxlR family transcriptional regulator
VDETAQTLAALDAAASAVGDRWSLLLVGALLDAGPLRFGELRERVPTIAPNILAGRLRALEAAGLVSAEPYSARPPRFSYDLTASGRELAGPIRLLAQWGAERAGADAPPRHGACGTPLEARLWCPTCGEPADDGAPVDHV